MVLVVRVKCFLINGIFFCIVKLIYGLFVLDWFCRVKIWIVGSYLSKIMCL